MLSARLFPFGSSPGEPVKERTLPATRTALELGSIDFIPENGGGPGVRLRKPDSPAVPE